MDIEASNRQPPTGKIQKGNLQSEQEKGEIFCPLFLKLFSNPESPKISPWKSKNISLHEIIFQVIFKVYSLYQWKNTELSRQPNTA